MLFSVPVLWLEIGADFGTPQYICVLAVPVLVSNSGPDFGLAKIDKTGPRPRQFGARPRATSACSAAAADCKKKQLFCTSDLSQNSQNEFSEHVIPTRSLPDRLSICSLQHLMTLRRGGFGTDRRSQIRDPDAGNSKQCLETVALLIFALMLR